MSTDNYHLQSEPIQSPHPPMTVGPVSTFSANAEPPQLQPIVGNNDQLPSKEYQHLLQWQMVWREQRKVPNAGCTHEQGDNSSQSPRAIVMGCESETPIAIPERTTIHMSISDMTPDELQSMETEFDERTERFAHDETQPTPHPSTSPILTPASDPSATSPSTIDLPSPTPSGDGHSHGDAVTDVDADAETRTPERRCKIEQHLPPPLPTQPYPFLLHLSSRRVQPSFAIVRAPYPHHLKRRRSSGSSSETLGNSPTSSALRPAHERLRPATPSDGAKRIRTGCTDESEDDWELATSPLFQHDGSEDGDTGEGGASEDGRPISDASLERLDELNF